MKINGFKSIFAVVGAFALLAGCSPGDATPSAAPATTEVAATSEPAASETTPEESKPAEPASGPLTVGLVMLQGDDYFRNVQLGLEKAVEADGGTVVPVNSNNDPGTEAQSVQNLIQRGVDAIIMQPVSADASAATIKSIRDAGIPVICYGNCTGALLEPTLVEGAAQSDNTALGTATGEAAAEYIKANLNNKAVVGILNCDSAAETCKLRKAGFKKALEDAGVEVDFAADQEGYLADKATPIATNMLSANPNINVVWGSNEGGTVGLVTAVKAANADVAVFGTDISEQIAGFVLDGSLKATTGQDPQSTVVQAYEMAKNAIAGTTNDPFENLILGITYRNDQPETTNEYLNK